MENSDTGPLPDGSRNEVVRDSYDWDSVSPAAAVIETVGMALDADPLTFDELYDYVDPDALNAVVRSAEPDIQGPTFSFEYAGRWVTVHSSGTVVVQDPI